MPARMARQRHVPVGLILIGGLCPFVGEPRLATEELSRNGALVGYRALVDGYPDSAGWIVQPGHGRRVWQIMPEVDRRQGLGRDRLRGGENSGGPSMQAAISFTALENSRPAGIEHGEFDLVFTERARPRARLTRLSLANLWLFDLESELPTVGCARIPDGVLMVALSTRGSLPLRWGGISAEPRDLVTIGPAQFVHFRTEAACRFGAIWLPAAKFAVLATAVTGRAIPLPPLVGRWHPPPGASGRLRRLYSAAIRISRAQKGRVAGAEAAHGLEQQLIHAVADCLCGEPATTAMPKLRQSQGLMSRFEEVVRRETGARPGVSALCEELGISQGALRQYCKQFLGMGPGSYIRLHREYSGQGALPTDQAFAAG